MNTPFLSPLPKKLTLFGDPELNKPFCLPCKARWVQLVALGGIEKMARTSSPCHFWRFSSFARGQYPRTAPTRKIRNLSHFLEVYLHIKIKHYLCLTFNTFFANIFAYCNGCEKEE